MGLERLSESGWVGRQMGDAVVVVRESRGEHCEQ